jgi:hypothetical protein
MNIKLLSPGTIIGAFGFLGMVLTQMGYAPAGAFLSDPHTAEAVSYLFSGALALVAGAAPNGPKAA